MTIARSEFICPACKRPHGDVSYRSLVYLDLPQTKKLILDALVGVYPRSLLANQLIDMIYFERPEGPPDHARRTLNTQIYQLNRTLKRYGWEVRGKSSGVRGGYKLAPLGKEG